MKQHKLDGSYNPNEFEEELYDEWEKNGYFKPNMKEGAKSYCIVMPPPNVTGKLHMGHALDAAIQDFLIRYKECKDLILFGFQEQIILHYPQRLK